MRWEWEKILRNIKWFDGFIKDETQIKVMPLLLNFFLLQLITVAFQKIYNELNKYPASNNKSNFELIKGLREKVEEIEKGTSRVRGEK